MGFCCYYICRLTKRGDAPASNPTTATSAANQQAPKKSVSAETTKQGASQVHTSAIPSAAAQEAMLRQITRNDQRAMLQKQQNAKAHQNMPNAAPPNPYALAGMSYTPTLVPFAAPGPTPVLTTSARGLDHQMVQAASRLAQLLETENSTDANSSLEIPDTTQGSSITAKPNAAKTNGKGNVKKKNKAAQHSPPREQSTEEGRDSIVGVAKATAPTLTAPGEQRALVFGRANATEAHAGYSSSSEVSGRDEAHHEEQRAHSKRSQNGSGERTSGKDATAALSAAAGHRTMQKGPVDVDGQRAETQSPLTENAFLIGRKIVTNHKKQQLKGVAGGEDQANASSKNNNPPSVEAPKHAQRSQSSSSASRSSRRFAADPVQQRQRAHAHRKVNDVASVPRLVSEAKRDHNVVANTGNPQGDRRAQRQTLGSQSSSSDSSRQSAAHTVEQKQCEHIHRAENAQSVSPRKRNGKVVSIAGNPQRGRRAQVQAPGQSYAQTPSGIPAAYRHPVQQSGAEKQAVPQRQLRPKLRAQYVPYVFGQPLQQPLPQAQRQISQAEAQRRAHNANGRVGHAPQLTRYAQAFLPPAQLQLQAAMHQHIINLQASHGQTLTPQQARHAAQAFLMQIQQAHDQLQAQIARGQHLAPQQATNAQALLMHQALRQRMSIAQQVTNYVHGGYQSPVLHTGGQNVQNVAHATSQHRLNQAHTNAFASQFLTHTGGQNVQNIAPNQARTSASASQFLTRNGGQNLQNVAHATNQHPPNQGRTNAPAGRFLTRNGGQNVENVAHATNQHPPNQARTNASATSSQHEAAQRLNQTSRPAEIRQNEQSSQAQQPNIKVITAGYVARCYPTQNQGVVHSQPNGGEARGTVQPAASSGATSTSSQQVERTAHIHATQAQSVATEHKPPPQPTAGVSTSHSHTAQTQANAPVAGQSTVEMNPQHVMVSGTAGHTCFRQRKPGEQTPQFGGSRTQSPSPPHRPMPNSRAQGKRVASSSSKPSQADAGNTKHQQAKSVSKGPQRKTSMMPPQAKKPRNTASRELKTASANPARSPGIGTSAAAAFGNGIAAPPPPPPPRGFSRKARLPAPRRRRNAGGVAKPSRRAPVPGSQSPSLQSPYAAHNEAQQMAARGYTVQSAYYNYRPAPPAPARVPVRQTPTQNATRGAPPSQPRARNARNVPGHKNASLPKSQGFAGDRPSPVRNIFSRWPHLARNLPRASSQSFFPPTHAGQHAPPVAAHKLREPPPAPAREQPPPTQGESRAPPPDAPVHGKPAPPPTKNAKEPPPPPPAQKAEVPPPPPTQEADTPPTDRERLGQPTQLGGAAVMATNDGVDNLMSQSATGTKRTSSFCFAHSALEI